MKVTYNQVIKELKAFFDSHYQVQEFRNGDLWEALETNSFDDSLYPLAFLVDNSATTSQGSLSLSFDLLIMDLVDKGEDNENEVKSDTLRIIVDTISYLEQLRDGDWYSVQVNKSATANSFTEDLADGVTGWKATITLSQPFNYNACSIPYSGVSHEDLECSPVTITDSDGVLIFSAPSGTTYQVADSVVSNSDDTYIENVKATDSLDLPDITHTDSDGSTVITPAQTPFVCTPITPEIPADGLIMNLDTSNDLSYTGNAINDLTPYRNDFNLVSNPPYLPIYGGVVEFDGVNDYGVNSTFELDMDNEFTTQIVAYLDSTFSAARPSLIMFKTNKTIPLNVFCSTNNGLWISSSGGVACAPMKTGVQVPLDTPFLLDISFDGVNHLDINSYTVSINLVNQPLVASVNSGLSVNINYLAQSLSSQFYRFKGYIPRVFVWNRVLTSTEKTNIYNILDGQYNF